MTDTAKPDTKPDSAEHIATLNDLCRTAMGIARAPGANRGHLRPRPRGRPIRHPREGRDVQGFQPGQRSTTGERDFGAFEHDGMRIFWPH